MAMSPETIARRAQERKREKELSKLTYIAHAVTVLENDVLHVQLGDVHIQGPVASVNVRLEQMGFRPVRITSNMLNPKSKRFAIDINTPAYCDPGCESYHSM